MGLARSTSRMETGSSQNKDESLILSCIMILEEFKLQSLEGNMLRWYRFTRGTEVQFLD